MGDSHYTDNFVEEDEIGHGGQGSVFKVTHKLTGMFSAVKKVQFKPNSTEETHNALQEVKCLAPLNHPHVVRLLHYWIEQDTIDTGPMGITTLQQKYIRKKNEERTVPGIPRRIKLGSLPPVPVATLYINMDLCSSTLENWIKRKNYWELASKSQDSHWERDQREERYRADVTEIFQQNLLGLEHIHAKGILHRDLKPSNIFLSESESEMKSNKGYLIVKIGDFGLSKLRQTASSDMLDGSDIAGSEDYIAPEISSSRYNSKVDIYSLGVMYLELCVRVTSHDLTPLVKAVRDGDFPEKLQTVEWSDEAGHLGKMLKVDPDERLGASDLLQLLDPRPPGYLRESKGINDPDTPVVMEAPTQETDTDAAAPVCW